MAYQHQQAGYQVIPVNPHCATVVPISQPQVQVCPPRPSATPAPERKPSPTLALIAVGVVGFILLSQSGGSSDLERQNAILQQQNADLRNRVDQLEYQLMGIYSAPKN